MLMCALASVSSLRRPCPPEGMHVYTGFISESLTRWGEPHIREILGGNMKTHLSVYEEGLFDLRGGGGRCPLSPPAPSPPPPPPQNIHVQCIKYMYVHALTPILYVCMYMYVAQFLHMCITFHFTVQAASAVPRTPLSMIPLKESERVNSTPLLRYIYICMILYIHTVMYIYGEI